MMLIYITIVALTIIAILVIILIRRARAKKVVKPAPLVAKVNIKQIGIKKKK
jgi:hypothetical protein